MKKIFLFFLIIILTTSCKDIADKWFGTSSSTPNPVPIGTDTTFTQAELDDKISLYISAQEKHIDSYNLILPKLDNTFVQQGDAATWTAATISTNCMLKQDVTSLWQGMKGIQLSSGTLIRHPLDVGGTSISKDLIALWLSMGAIAYHTDCEPVKSEFGASLIKFIEYGRDNNWEYGLAGRKDLSTTLLVGRQALKAVSSLYNLGYSDSALNMNTSISNVLTNASMADFINENYYKCHRNADQVACLRIVDQGVFGNHLTFQTILIHYIEALHVEDPVYKLKYLKLSLESLARVGDNIGYNNWLFVSAYRKLVLQTDANDDIFSFLYHKFPDSLPTEKVGVEGWGCTDFIWQRVPGENCNNSNLTHIGTDFLMVVGILKGL